MLFSVKYMIVKPSEEVTLRENENIALYASKLLSNSALLENETTRMLEIVKLHETLYTFYRERNMQLEGFYWVISCNATNSTIFLFNGVNSSVSINVTLGSQSKTIDVQKFELKKLVMQNQELPTWLKFNISRGLEYCLKEQLEICHGYGGLLKITEDDNIRIIRTKNIEVC
jgi:hypothetical protein